MRLTTPTRKNIVTLICYLYILLFVYAAISKFLDFENFQTQLGQSPLLSAYAGWVAPIVLVLELLIALLLMFHKTRYAGLVGSYFIMVLFTVYIYLILNFSSFVPCSCGGVLEKMTWSQHLIFNICFALLAIIALFLIRSTKITFISVFAGGLLNGLIVYGLFLQSENTMKFDNPFIRRFSDFVVKDSEIDLKHNSYYYAGGTSSTLYLGNYTSPLILTKVDTALQKATPIRFELDQADLPFKTVQVQADSTNFYLFDGSVPCFFRGKIKDGRASMVGLGTTFFSTGVLCDSSRLLIRSHNRMGENSIGVSNYNEPFSSHFHYTLLEKQFDGNFDTDGMLMYDSNLNKGVYIYRYRNEYIVFDPTLENVAKGRTIDTISQAQLKIVYNDATKEKKLAGTPLVVNYNSSVYNGLLFVQSGLVGRFEDRKMWQQASVIDVYNIRNRTYIASFYIYHIDQKKLSRFFVLHNHFYAFIGSKLVRYKLTDMITSHFLEPTIYRKTTPAGGRATIENLYNRVDH
ncbi:MauE/DoxX family redox-associated membrane protein [Flavobacterium sp.]|uniref:MauE/DoxX family redox-associated membrane protein n=1 Tax=Flavobacterium sp. TaxID=239 RepID=UPI00345B6D92